MRVLPAQSHRLGDGSHNRGVGDPTDLPELRGLTVTQPFASLLASGAKQIETRSWATSYRGLILIHAAATVGAEGRRLIEALDLHGEARMSFQLCGYALAVAELVDVQPTDVLAGEIDDYEFAVGDYAPGRFGWIFTNVRKLRPPVPMKGNRRLWHLTPSQAYGIMGSSREQSAPGVP